MYYVQSNQRVVLASEKDFKIMSFGKQIERRNNKEPRT
jgi:hypothetical protein